MTTQIRARVRRRFEPCNGRDRYSQPWIASVVINGETQYRSLTPAGSHPEAMQAAYKLLADADAALTGVTS